jgi:hypothetical protein
MERKTLQEMKTELVKDLDAAMVQAFRAMVDAAENGEYHTGGLDEEEEDQDDGF